MLKTESRLFIFSCAYANMKPWVTLWLFNAFKGEYPVFLSDIIFFKFRMQTAFHVNKSSTLFKAFTVELRWLEPLWDHENLFETAVTRASEGYY